MARSRNIKPGFFYNEYLAELDPLARILFAGLWTIADREGRLEDRPKRIKIETLPYDDCDIDTLLQSLNDAGFILRYEAGGKKYIQILNFSKHQNPHKNEAQSTIPPVPEVVPEEHHTSTVQAPDKHNTNRADSLLLIPDSLDDEEDDNARARGEGKADNCQTENNCGEVVRLFEQEFGRPLSPMESQEIRGWLDKHPQELITQALKEAVIRGAVRIKYIDTILADWKKNNIRTASEAIQYTQKRKKHQARGDPKVKDALRDTCEDLDNKYADIYMT